MRKINYKSDFDCILRVKDRNGDFQSFPDCNWEIRFYTSSKVNSYIVSRTGDKYVNCFATEDGGIHVVFDNHGLGVGVLKWEPHFELPNSIYPDGVQDIFSNYSLEIELVTGQGDLTTDVDVSINVPFLFTNLEDLENKVDREEFNSALENKADKSVVAEIEQSLSTKAEKAELLTKADVSALELKADKTDLENKADKVEVTSALAEKADKAELSQKADKSELANKANKSDLEGKANKEDIETALAGKANVESLALKADKTELANKADKTELANKADLSALDLKADKSEVISQAELDTKADKTELSNILGVPTDNVVETIEETIVTTALRKTAQTLTAEEQLQVKKNLGIADSQPDLKFRRGVISLYSEPGVIYRNIGQVRLPMRGAQTKTFDLAGNGLDSTQVIDFTCGFGGIIDDNYPSAFRKVSDCVEYDGASATITYDDEVFQSESKLDIAARNSMRVVINIDTPFIMKNKKGEFIGLDKCPAVIPTIPAPVLKSCYKIKEPGFILELLKSSSCFKTELQKKVRRERRDINGTVKEPKQIYRTWTPCDISKQRLLIGIYRVRAVTKKYESAWVVFSAGGDFNVKQKITVF